METDKFEKHIKAKLQEREINPSENAWSKISSELKDDDRKKKPVYLRIGVAASIIVLLGVALFYFNGANELNESPIELVETENENKVEEVITKDPVQEEQVVIVETNTKTESTTVKKEEYKIPEVQENKTLNDAVEIAVVENVPGDQSTSKLEVSDEIINSKVADIVAQIDVLEQYSTVTDAEVDSLLKRAQDEILRDKIFNTDKSVDAMALLTEVEEELDQSFRDQIFNSLKAGFIKVRTAVADRNN
ncbi:hypothetical protein CLV90_3629 [Maribacter spongiicola]|uniref:Uncharacterized protein n=1 Tax=Maribacter spongiicola TaxID=1206753 RepID=A0A4V3EPQ2_9FLAO|nr:hypothetical protein [Maribacter spongiicola]TDT38658.1 hypothetical protein CLV90_3629 [Maribacter spongiicola]